MHYEVRRISEDWVHPVDFQDRYISLYKYTDDFFNAIVKEGIEDYDANPEDFNQEMTRSELVESMPKYAASIMMPNWSEDQKTHLMMYKVSDGTPISPSFAKDSELAEWLASNYELPNGQKASYEYWMWVTKWDQFKVLSLMKEEFEQDFRLFCRIIALMKLPQTNRGLKWN